MDKALRNVYSVCFGFLKAIDWCYRNETLCPIDNLVPSGSFEATFFVWKGILWEILKPHLLYSYQLCYTNNMFYIIKPFNIIYPLHTKCIGNLSYLLSYSLYVFVYENETPLSLYNHIPYFANMVLDQLFI